MLYWFSRSYNFNTINKIAPTCIKRRSHPILRWLETLFEKCEKNGFEHDILDYYRVLKGKQYHSGMRK